MSEWIKKPFNLFATEEACTRVGHLRRLMLVHSCIYYEMNTNVVDDHRWQAWADELTGLQLLYGHEFGFYDDAFKGWDGSTGYHLPLRDEGVLNAARRLVDNPKVKRQHEAAVDLFAAV